VERRSAQERLEALRSGRLLLSAGIVVLLACMVVENLPASSLRAAAEPAAAHVLAATGVDQQWNIFAPDPRAVSIQLEARVRFRDGSTSTWRPPRGNALTGQYWDYHWGKLVEHVTFDQGPSADALRDGVARYAARQVQAPGRAPSQVTLVSLQQRDGHRSAQRLYRLDFGELFGP
jgi:hypothetical protein